MNISIYINVAHDLCNSLIIIGIMNVNVIFLDKVVSVGMLGRLGSIGC